MTATPHKRILSSAMILFAGSGTGAILSFLLSVLIGRYLGTAGLGAYAAVLAWVFPVSLLAEGGIGTWMVRQIASDPLQIHAAVRTGIMIRMLIALPLSLLMWLLAPALSTEPAVSAGIRLSAPLIFIVPMTGIFNSVFRARHWMLPVALLNVGMLLVQVLLLLIVLHNNGSVQDALIVNTVTSIGQMFAAWGIYRRWCYLPASISIPVQLVLRESLPFAAAAILAAVQTRINFLLLEQYAGTSAVGLYAASVRFIEAGRLFPQAYLEALFPTLTALAANPEQMRRTFQRAAGRLLLYGILAAGILIAGAALFITIPYGDEFSAAVPVLTVLAVSIPLLGLKGVRTLYWYAQHQEGYTNTVTLTIIIIQALVARLLIPAGGAVGAAVAAIIAELSGVILLWYRR